MWLGGGGGLYERIAVKDWLHRPCQWIICLIKDPRNQGAQTRQGKENPGNRKRKKLRRENGKRVEAKRNGRVLGGVGEGEEGDEMSIFSL